jgi:hypothetical protein
MQNMLDLMQEILLHGHHPGSDVKMSSKQGSKDARPMEVYSQNLMPQRNAALASKNSQQKRSLKCACYTGVLTNNTSF